MLREPDDNESGRQSERHFAAFFGPRAAHNTPGQTVIQIGIRKALRDFNRCGLRRGNHPDTRLKPQKLGAFRSNRRLNNVLFIKPKGKHGPALSRVSRFPPRKEDCFSCWKECRMW